MSKTAKIGKKNPAAVVRDVTEALPRLQSLVAVGFHIDGSISMWASEHPNLIDRAAITMMRYAQEELGGPVYEKV